MSKPAIWTGLALIAVIVLLLVVWKVISVVLMVFAAALFAIFLDALAGWIEWHTRLSHGWSLAAVAVGLGLIGAGIAVFAAPRLTSQTRQLVQQLPAATTRARQALEDAGVPAKLLEGSTRGSAVSRVLSYAATTLDAAVAAFVVAVVGLYFAASPHRYREMMVTPWPEDSRSRVTDALNDAGDTLQRWLMGRIFLMFVDAVLTTIGLWIIGVPLALILGVLVGLLSFVPNLGPLIAAIPALLLGLTQGISSFIGVAVLYLAVQTIDGYVLTPLVQKKALDLPPALILIGQVVAGILLGTGGVLLATPMLAVGKVFLSHVGPEGRQQGGRRKEFALSES